MARKRDDEEEVDNDGFWYCTRCGDSGRCTKGDEAMCLALHEAFMH